MTGVLFGLLPMPHLERREKDKPPLWPLGAVALALCGGGVISVCD